MRRRTEERRRHIVEQAAAIFREHGFDRTSMAQISARVGGSKTTLYGYFASKEDLFATVMLEAVDAQAGALGDMLDIGTDDPRAALTAFGLAYLRLILSPEIIKVTRIGIAESDEKIGAKLYEQGPHRGWQTMAGHLQRWVDQGVLRPVPSHVLALHLKGLLEAGALEPSLFGIKAAIGREEGVRLAIDAFLRAYGDGPPTATA